MSLNRRHFLFSTSTQACSDVETATERNWRAIGEILKQSGAGLTSKEQRELGALMHEFVDIFAADERDCTHTDIMQHHIDTNNVPPIQMRLLRRLPFARCMLPVLSRVRAGEWPDYAAIADHCPEIKVLYLQWGGLAMCDGLLFCQWERPNEQGHVLQLLSLFFRTQLRGWVLELVHEHVGAGHFGVAKTLNRLRDRLYWSNCRMDAELFVPVCDTCMAQKGPTQRSHASLQNFWVGAPTERVGVDILGPFPHSERGNCYVLVVMDYFTKWPKAYGVPYQSAATTAKVLVEEMFCRFCAPEKLL